MRCVALSRTGERSADSVVADLEDRSALAHACNGVDTVLHCAGYAHAFSDSDPEAHWRINFDGTRNLADAAGLAGVKRFVYLSSVKAMAEPGDGCIGEDWPGEPETPYGRAKRAAEEVVIEAGIKYGMHVTNLRLAMVYGRGGRGNLERMARGVRAGWFPPLPETGNRRSVVHVDDVIAAIRLVAATPAANRQTFIVSDAHPYSGREIYDAMRDALGRAPVRRRVPEVVLRAAGASGDTLGRWLNRTLPLNSEMIARLLDSACYSSVRIERELGWRARIVLTTGLREMLA